LGKYHSASADSYSDAESFAVSQRNIDIVSGAIAIAITNICISHCDSGSSGSWRTDKPDAYANSFTTSVSTALRDRAPADLKCKASSFLAGVGCRMQDVGIRAVLGAIAATFLH
jgi:hypothetical protein